MFPDPKKYNIKISTQAMDFIKRLLHKDPTRRLGYEGDVEEVFAHPWLEDIDREALLNLELEVPIIPKTIDPEKL